VIDLVNRNLRSGPVDEEFLAGAVLAAHHHILRGAPLVEAPPETDVEIMGFRVAVAILFPEQLQRGMPVGGQFPAYLCKVGKLPFG
jgi:hypothetical protein